METLDMRGQPCPIPVVNAKKALAGGAREVAVLVDNIVAAQNLEKMAAGTGCAFSYTEDEPSRYRVVLTKGGSPAGGGAPDAPRAAPRPEPAAGAGGRGPVVLITSDSLGRGAEDLGRLLIKGFIFSLTQLEPPPEALIFLNGGARLTTRGANTIPDLKTLEAKGTGIYTCGTCANYYKLTDALASGGIIDMMAVTDRLARAASVITI